MFRSAIIRPWICYRCLHHQSQTRKGLVTAATQYLRPQQPPVDSATPGAQNDDRVLRQIFDSASFWKEFSQTSKYGYGKKSAGLFQNRYLTEPRGFEQFANDSLQKAKRLVEKVLSAKSLHEYKDVVRDLDRLSDLLCRVIDLSDFVRATHPDSEIQAAATRAYAMVFEYMNILNTTTGLDKQLSFAMETSQVFGALTEEERVVADILKKDFAKSAIDLPRAQRERFVTLSQEISEVGPDFVDNMAPAQQSLRFPSSYLKGLDPLLVREHSVMGQVYLPTVGGVAAAALRTVRDEGVRKQLLLASRTSSRSTIHKLETLLRKRAELAQLSGFSSYAHLCLSDKMAKSPESVALFLQALSKDNSKIVRLEMAELLKAKVQSFPSVTPTLYSWDKEYYIAQALSASPSKVRNADFLSSFLSLGTVMQGLSRLFTRLYGIRFVPRETLPGETWNSDVRRLDVISETDGFVAVLYCDLFSRAGKSPNPAHFTLRCSRKISNEELVEASSFSSHLFNTPEEAANDGMALSSSHGHLMQLPTIALICDFATSSGSHKPALLSFSELTTLFHEMGHAIHSILGRTHLQNVSGTRCATDFAELPSVLMEYFAADPTVLALFARHHETDQSLPYDMVAQRMAMEKKFQGTDIENQVILSMVDQAYHSVLPLESSFDSTQIYHEIQKSNGASPPDPPGTCWQGFFGHLYGYGSTYYSYLFDRALAKRVWQVVFNSGFGNASVSRESGERMKEAVLRWGGGKDPWRCLADALQDERLEGGDKDAMAVVGSWGVMRQRDNIR